jgi:hypothetical protein
VEEVREREALGVLAQLAAIPALLLVLLGLGIAMGVTRTRQRDPSQAP